MDWALGAAIILGMFILRLGVPLLITVAIGYGLRRLDARWQAEAQAQWEVSQARKKAALGPIWLDMLTQPCWVIKECPETLSTNCPAFKQPDIPCWMARFRAEGQLPAQCYRCELYQLKGMEHKLN